MENNAEAVQCAKYAVLSLVFSLFGVESLRTKIILPGKFYFFRTSVYQPSPYYSILQQNRHRDRDSFTLKRKVLDS
jgi:hypothetical protein